MATTKEERVEFTIQKAKIISSDLPEEYETEIPKYLFQFRDDSSVTVITDKSVIGFADRAFDQTKATKWICCYGHWGENGGFNIDGLAPMEEWWVELYAH